MKKHTSSLQTDTFYHVYNRGINGENLFKEERNYGFFLRKYAFYIQPAAATYAYCLLKNHFHLLIRTRGTEEIIQNLRSNVGRVLNPADVHNPADVTHAANRLISNQFSKLFNSYAQAINKTYGRTGGLFEEPFRRIPIEHPAYLTELVYYIHSNPQKHGLADNFREYPHSSYLTHLSKLDTQLRRKELMTWFSNEPGYKNLHLSNQVLEHLDKFEIEFD